MPEESGGQTRWTHAEQHDFAIWGDAWTALGISPNVEIILDKDGSIIDIYDPVTKQLFTFYGKVIGTRDERLALPVPPEKAIDMTDEELAEAMAKGIGEMTKEARVIETVRASFADKYKDFRKLKREKNKRDRAEKQGYNPRYRIYKRFPVYTGTYRRATIQTTGFFAT